MEKNIKEKVVEIIKRYYTSDEEYKGWMNPDWVDAKNTVIENILFDIEQEIK